MGPGMSLDRPAKSVDDDLRSRRDLVFTATAMALFGIGAASWPLIDSMNPSAEARVPDWLYFGDLLPGQRKTLYWRGSPIFIAHRTPEEIAAAQADYLESPYPELDRNRTVRDEYLIVYGICPTHGCLLRGQRSDDNRGRWGGWACPCDADHYDLSGRLRSRWGKANLIVPQYYFESNTAIFIGPSWRRTRPTR